MAPTADHPRECGANRIGNNASPRVAGSSPRVRGKPVETVDDFTGHRIIPASAGQTSKSPDLLKRSADHPRECGANILSAVMASAAIGSSPRVRGKRHEGWHLQLRRRIIPASAGQTFCPAGRDGVSPDHPRECGANPDSDDAGTRPRGSSPRVRGKLDAVPQ